MSDQAPDLMEPVIGWRSFRHALTGELVSQSLNAVWEPGANRARCPNGHQTPEPDCQCGLYAWTESQHPSLDVVEVYAATRNWGRTQIHYTGLRSEFAEIVCLVAPVVDRDGNRSNWGPLVRTAHRYGVPLFFSLKEAEEFASQYGSPVPEELKPEPEPPDDHYAAFAVANGSIAPGVGITLSTSWDESTLKKHRWK